MLSNEGVKRTIPAIRAWLKEDCIGSEDEAIVAIALITQDRELNDKLDEVIAATQIRSLHIRLGRYRQSNCSLDYWGSAFGRRTFIAESDKRFVIACRSGVSSKNSGNNRKCPAQQGEQAH